MGKRNLLLILSNALLLIFANLAIASETDSACKADFIMKPYDGPKILIYPGPAIYSFFDQSAGNAVKWIWAFSDGDTSYEQNPVHSFRQPVWSSKPAYYIEPGMKIGACLSITTADGCTSYTCKYTTLDPDTGAKTCSAYFTYYRDDSVYTFKAVDGTMIKFLDYSKGNVVSWLWDFGDGTTSTEQNPMHTYVQSDSFRNAKCGKCITMFYNVILTIHTSDNCTSQYTQTVSLYNPPPVSCVAYFKYFNLNSDPLTYVFEDASQGNVSSWSWSFGDGSFSNDPKPIHKFKPYPVVRDTDYKNASYQVCLTINTNDGCSDTHCEMVYGYPGNPDTTIKPCTSQIKLSTTSILGSSECKGTAIASLINQFNNEPVQATNCYWSTGDTGFYTSGLCPNTTYKVSLQDESGCSVTGSFALADYIDMPVYWQYKNSGQDYYFDIYKYNNPNYTYEWQFSDGTIKEGSETSYNFSGTGEKSVRLVVYNTDNSVVYTENIDLADPTSINNTTVNPIRWNPNPVIDELNIELNSPINQNLNVSITNLSGQTLINKRFSPYSGQREFTISVATLPKGLYICKVNSGKLNIPAFKFIK